MTKMGFKRDPASPKRLRRTSPKQRKRTDVLQDKLEILKKTQTDLYGAPCCETTSGVVEWKHKCPGKYPLVVDHVGTRNQVDADRFANLQLLCTWCNYQKGSVRIDFRPQEMRDALRALDLAKPGLTAMGAEAQDEV